MNILNLLAAIGCFVTLIWAWRERGVVQTFHKWRMVAFFVSNSLVALFAGLNSATAILAFGPIVALPIIILAVGTGWAIVYRKGW